MLKFTGQSLELLSDSEECEPRPSLIKLTSTVCHLHKNTKTLLPSWLRLTFPINI